MINPRLIAAVIVTVVCCGLWTTPARAQQEWTRSWFGRSSVIVRGQEGESPEAGAEPEDPFEEHLETDRDAFTPSTVTVNPGRFLIESSYSFIDNRRAADTNSFPELVVRYGLAERFELRLGWNYEVGGGGNVVSSIEGEEGLEGRGIERESRALYGFKWRINDQTGWIPESSFLAQGFTPTTGDATATEAALTYVWGWKLPRDWKLDAGIRYASSTDRDDDFAIWNPSVALRVPLDDRLGVHAEYFGGIPHGRVGGQAQHFFSPGLRYLITPDLEIGFRVGWGLNDASARFFSNAGIGWRF